MTRRAITKGSHNRSIILSGVAGLTLLLATSCGGGPDGNAANAQITKLLPESTVAVVRIASLDELNKHNRSITKEVSGSDNSMDLRDMLAMSGMPGDARLIDPSLPIVLAISSKRATPATIAAIVPTTDTAAYVASLNAGELAVETDGNYVAVPVFGAYKRADTAPQILANLKPGALSVHANLESLTQTYKVAINSGIELFEQQMADMMEMADPNIDGEVIAELYGAIGRAISGSAKTLDVSANYKNGMLDFDVALDALPDSTMAGWSSPATDMTSLATGMTGEGSVEALFQMDMDKMMPRLNDFMAAVADIYPKEFQAAMQELMTAYEAVYEQLESGVLMEGDLFGEDGIRMTAQMMPKDPTKFVALITDLLRSDAMKKIGLTADTPQTSTDGDTNISDLNIAIDSKQMLEATSQQAIGQEQASQAMEAMFGDGLQVRIAQRADRVVMTFGKEREVAAKRTLDASQGSWSPAMQTAVDRLKGCNPMIIERIDMGRLMAGVFASMAQQGTNVPPTPKNANANVLFYGGIKGDQWRGGLSIDIAGMAQIAESFSPR
ncbi:MAG: hypothetical protein ACI85K_003174 [Hyphomicrobiaceae bacterium]|jgi:hypothetical protein